MVEENKYTFTIEDIEQLIENKIRPHDSEDFVFHWNFDMNKPGSVNNFPVLTIEQKRNIIFRCF